MIATLRIFCLAMAALLCALAPAARAGDGCCHGSAAGGHVPPAVAPAAADALPAGAVTGGRCGCCGANCHCTAPAPARGCDCARKAPTRPPVPAVPAPTAPPPTIGLPPACRGERELPPDVATASRLRGATASGLPNVLLPARSRQEALSVWLC